MQEKSEGLRQPPRVLIFANRVKTVRFLYQAVIAEGFKVVMLHGDRSQPEREVRAILNANSPIWRTLGRLV